MHSERTNFYRLLLVVSDVGAITAAFFASYAVRADLLSGLVGPLYPLSRYYWLLGVALLSWPTVFGFLRLYEVEISLDDRSRTFYRVAVRLFQALFLGGLILSLLLFAFRLYFTSRLLTFLFVATSYLLLLLGRSLVHVAYVRRGRRASLLNILIVGTNPRAQRLAASLARNAHVGARVLGFVSETEEPPQARPQTPPVLGTMRELPDIVSRSVVDQVVVSVPSARLDQVRPVFYLCEEQGIKVSVVCDFLPPYDAQPRLVHFENAALISIANAPGDDSLLVAKRVLDLGLATFFLVLSLPVFLLVPLLIKLDSRGTVFFRQTRVGLHGRKFTLFKFRSMVEEAEVKKGELRTYNEAEEPIFKMARDPRVTTVGRLLRKTSMDELPQLFNVLRGDMSLVGPRPPVPEEVARYQPSQRRRLSVKPGLTGLWQVRGRSQLSFDEYVKLDLYYIDNWSLLLDLKILAQTVPVVLAGRGAH